MLSSRQLLAVAAYLVLWGVLVAIGDFRDDADVFLVPLWVGGSVLVGAITDKWWSPIVVGLLTATVVLVIGETFDPCGQDPGDTDCGNEAGKAYLLFFPMTAVLIGVGVIAGKVLRHFWPAGKEAG